MKKSKSTVHSCVKSFCFFSLLLCSSLHLYSQVAPPEALEAACGSAKDHLDGEVTNQTQPPTTAPEGKAVLVFIEDLRTDRPGHHCFGCNSISAALAMDGRWIAIGKGFSHAVAVIDAGEHHFCARVRKGNNDTPAMLQLRAEAGFTYYLIAIPQYEYDYYIERFAVGDPDEGRYLFGISKPVTLSRKP